MGRSLLSKPLASVAVIAALAFSSCTTDSNQPQNGKDTPQSEITLAPITGDALTGRMAYAPDGSIVAVTGHTIGVFNGDSASLVVDPYIALYDAKTGQFLRKIMGKLLPWEINSAGDRLLVQDQANDYKLAVYDINTGNLLFKIEDRWAQFMHDGDRLFVERKQFQHYYTDAFDIRSATSGDIIKTLDVKNGELSFISITPDDRFIALRTGSYTPSYYLLDVETEIVTATHAISAPTSSGSASENGNVVILFSYDGESVEFLEPSSGVLLSTLSREFAYSGHMSIANDKERYATMDCDGISKCDINLRQITDGVTLRTVASIEHPTNMAFSADAKTLAVGFAGGVTIFDVQ